MTESSGLVRSRGHFDFELRSVWVRSWGHFELRSVRVRSGGHSEVRSG